MEWYMLGYERKNWTAQMAPAADEYFCVPEIFRYNHPNLVCGRNPWCQCRGNADCLVFSGETALVFQAGDSVFSRWRRPGALHNRAGARNHDRECHVAGFGNQIHWCPAGQLTACLLFLCEGMIHRKTLCRQLRARCLLLFCGRAGFSIMRLWKNV